MYHNNNYVRGRGNRRGNRRGNNNYYNNRGRGGYYNNNNFHSINIINNHIYKNNKKNYNNLFGKYIISQDDDEIYSK